jgi:hypothetical protein
MPSSDKPFGGPIDRPRKAPGVGHISSPFACTSPALHAERTGLRGASLGTAPDGLHNTAPGGCRFPSPSVESGLGRGEPVPRRPFCTSERESGLLLSRRPTDTSAPESAPRLLRKPSGKRFAELSSRFPPVRTDKQSRDTTDERLPAGRWYKESAVLRYSDTRPAGTSQSDVGPSRVAGSSQDPEPVPGNTDPAGTPAGSPTDRSPDGRSGTS